MAGVYYFGGAFYGNPLTSVIIEGKSSADDFEEYKGTVHGLPTTPFGWDENITCIKDNDTNVENGCITWMG